MTSAFQFVSDPEIQSAVHVTTDYVARAAGSASHSTGDARLSGVKAAK